MGRQRKNLLEYAESEAVKIPFYSFGSYIAGYGLAKFLDQPPYLKLFERFGDSEGILISLAFGMGLGIVKTVKSGVDHFNDNFQINIARRHSQDNSSSYWQSL